MRLTYDPKHNIAYLYLQKRKVQVQTVHISESLNVDLAPDGSVYGIELLDANKQLRGDGKNRLIIENIATGKSTKLDLVSK